MNRVRMIHFGRLTAASAERILDLEIERIARRYREVHDLELRLDPSGRREILARGFSPSFGARRLAATLESVCNVAISQRIRRDDRRGATDGEALLDRLRALRRDARPFDPNELRGDVLSHVRARLDYAAIRIAFREGAFVYEPEEHRS
jgi:hypothetical protein